MTRDCFINLLQDPKSAESTKEEDGVKSDDKSRIGRESRLVVAGLALAGIADLSELTGIGVENDGVGIERVGGPGVKGLVDSDVSSLASIAAALRRSTETVSSRPLRSILKVLSPRESTWQGPSYEC